jgi:PA domain
MVANHFKQFCAMFVLACTITAAPLVQAVEIVIYPSDTDGVGFFDPTPVAPIGGNTGATLGEQRANVFLFVADLWGKRLQSNVPVQVIASFGPLECDKDKGTLGGAGPLNRYSDFPNAPRTGTLYPSALANKLAGVRLSSGTDIFSTADIISSFNGKIGQPGCLDGVSFYLGLDGKAPAGQVDLMKVVAHEFAHGLGFQTFTDGMFGNQQGGVPSVWDHFLYDLKQKKTWAQMDFLERPRSAKGWRNLVWTGKNVQLAVPRTLKPGVPDLYVVTNSKRYQVAPALTGPQIDAKTYAVGQFARVTDQADGKQACSPLSAQNAAAVWGNIVLIDADGGCNFFVKVKNAQNAGAQAVIGAANVTLPSDAPLPLYLLGNDPAIKIPVVGITATAANEIKAQIAATTGNWRTFPSWGTLASNPALLNGADEANRAYMYTALSFMEGSSVSHYDISSEPHLLMQPSYAGNKPGIPALSAPLDLTLELLKDIGW